MSAKQDGKVSTCSRSAAESSGGSSSSFSSGTSVALDGSGDGMEGLEGSVSSAQVNDSTLDDQHGRRGDCFFMNIGSISVLLILLVNYW